MQTQHELKPGSHSQEGPIRIQNSVAPLKSSRLGLRYTEPILEN